MDNLEEIKVNEEDVAQDVVEESAQPKKKAKSLEVNKKTTIVAITVIMILIIASIIMAYVIPMGSYERFTNEDGNVELVKDSFSYDDSLGRIAWWKVILAPFLVLGSEGSITLISILALLVVIGAIFNALDETEILLYAVRLLKHKYQDKKYLLLFLIPLLFMFLSTTAGVFEEIIPLIPVMVLFCYGFGWDSIIALAISVVPAAFGYTASVCNPFTIGIAQELVGIPMFSGVGLRLLTFVVGYIIIMVFVFPYAKKIDKNTRVKILGMPDVCESGVDFMEESTLWDSYHVMMKHFRDENRTRYRSDNFYQFTVTSEFGILYQFYLNALDISPNIAQYVDIDEDAAFLERKYTNSETEKIYKEAVKQRNDLYKDFPEQTIYNN